MSIARRERIARDPVDWLMQTTGGDDRDLLTTYAHWWTTVGRDISDTVDRWGTPWLQVFDPQGEIIDRVVYPPEYRTMLDIGYQTGIVWRTFATRSFQPFVRLGYVTAYFDPGVFCPYTVTLATALALHKYGPEPVRKRWLNELTRTAPPFRQGATWMTEIRGGSDLGYAVETVAIPIDPETNVWRLTGYKYFASNVDADAALVAARPQNAPSGIRGLALFLVPRWTDTGQLNYRIRRIKDKIGTRSVPTGEVELIGSAARMIGSRQHGIYLILETLNLSRVANSIASVALMHRCMVDALAFAEQRRAFGRPIVDHPLMRSQFRQRRRQLQYAWALTWTAATWLDTLWNERPPYSDRYHAFRLLTHLAKFWTAELAVQTAKWVMEVHGGIGVLREFGVERWLREAMILPIWEGTPHRQMLDGLEAMVRKRAHVALLETLCPGDAPREWHAWIARIDRFLTQSPSMRETRIERLFRRMAEWLGRRLWEHMQRHRIPRRSPTQPHGD